MQEQPAPAPAFYLRDVSKTDMSNMIDNIILDWQKQQATRQDEIRLQQQREEQTRARLQSPHCVQSSPEETQSFSVLRTLKTVWNNDYVLDAETENAIELFLYTLFETQL